MDQKYQLIFTTEDGQTVPCKEHASGTVAKEMGQKIMNISGSLKPYGKNGYSETPMSAEEYDSYFVDPSESPHRTIVVRSDKCLCIALSIIPIDDWFDTIEEMADALDHPFD